MSLAPPAGCWPLPGGGVVLLSLSAPHWAAAERSVQRMDTALLLHACCPRSPLPPAALSCQGLIPGPALSFLTCDKQDGVRDRVQLCASALTALDSASLPVSRVWTLAAGGDAPWAGATPLAYGLFPREARRHREAEDGRGRRGRPRQHCPPAPQPPTDGHAVATHPAPWFMI